MKNNNQFGSTLEATIYPLIVLVLMWLSFWADHLFPQIDFYKYGIMPKDESSLIGVLTMPLIHSKEEIEHIINNSMPTAVLLGAIIYYYRKIAFRVFTLAWLMTGVGVWLFAENTNSFHIGMSGVVYAMAGFLFTSGVIRKHRSLQAISLFVAFVYGSMIWGVFPIQAHVSWEGHLMGLLSGVVLAFIYRKMGPQAPKYQYEIEQELGIDPPDLEGQWNERIRQAEERERQQEELKREQEHFIRYHYVSKSKGKEDKDVNSDS